jgi:hypothetical protein
LVQPLSSRWDAPPRPSPTAAGSYFGIGSPASTDANPSDGAIPPPKRGSPLMAIHIADVSGRHTAPRRGVGSPRPERNAGPGRWLGRGFIHWDATRYACRAIRLPKRGEKPIASGRDCSSAPGNQSNGEPELNCAKYNGPYIQTRPKLLHQSLHKHTSRRGDVARQGRQAPHNENACHCGPPRGAGCARWAGRRTNGNDNLFPLAELATTSFQGRNVAANLNHRCSRTVTGCGSICQPNNEAEQNRAKYDGPHIEDVAVIEHRRPLS